MDNKTIGKYAFLAGVVLALLGVWVDAIAELTWLLPILGLVAGILYIDIDDATGYYIFVGAVLVAAGSGSLGFLGETIDGYVTGWMEGLGSMLGAGALALILRTLVGRFTS